MRLLPFLDVSVLRNQFILNLVAVVEVVGHCSVNSFFKKGWEYWSGGKGNCFEVSVGDVRLDLGKD